MFLLTQSTHRMVIQYHPRIGHLYVPNQRARIPNERGGSYVVTNGQGFRSDLEFKRERGDKPRILFFGDSFTAGDGVGNAERYAELVGAELGAEVYNYAVSGTGTDQQLLIMEELAEGVDADLIVLCVYVENIERIKVAYRESLDRFTRQKVLVPKPYFTLDGAELNLHNVPVPLERPNAEEVDKGRYQSTEVITNPVREWIIKPLSKHKNHPAVRTAREVVRERMPWLLPAFVRRTGFQPHKDYASAETPGWRLMEEILRRFVGKAGSRPVLIVPIPSHYFYHDALDPIYQPLFSRLEDPGRGVHVADITRPLTQLSWADKKRIPFKYDAHFSPFGHRQVARHIADAIQSKGLWARVQASAQASVPAKVESASARVEAGEAGAPSAPTTERPRRPTYVLGLSCFYHDSAACLIQDGEIVAAAEEERFTRVKNDKRFPHFASNYCLEEAGIQQHDLSAVVYYDNAPLTFERLLHTLAAVGPEGRDSWDRILPSWLRFKLHIPQLIRRELKYDGLVLHEGHHRSHAASAFYPSPFERAAIVTIDGVGEWATGSIGVGNGREIKLLKEMRFPHSLGLLYSAFTQFTGFKVNSGEYKMMGLAPYGEPKYVDIILDKLIDLKEDGSIELNMEYFGFLTKPTMTNEKFAELFGGPARTSEAWMTKRERDLSRSIQVVTEEAILRTARYAHKLTGEKKLVMAGGVALNCVANGRLLREGPFEDIWIQPAAGDAGGAMGAAFDAYHTYFDKPRTMPADKRPRQGGSYWGPAYSDNEIEAFLKTHGYAYRRLADAERADTVARILAEGKVVGHFAGRVEFGPRSLGARAILGDARNEEMQVNLNLKIKYRESFRPFAPSVLAERVSDYFELDRESPYMLLVAPVKESRRLPMPPMTGDDLTAIVRQPRSDLPAITHVDYSARVQTVMRSDHPAYYDVIKKFEEQTGCGVIVNTSFNVRGEPIVCTPDDAYRCFMRTNMDVLVLGNYLLRKEEQPAWPEPKGHVEEDDDPKAKPAVEAAFADALNKAFFDDFLPVVSGLGKRDVLVQTQFKKAPSMWADVEEASGRAVFAIPPALDSAAPDPERMADAITSFWSRGPAAERLRPVVVKLLQIGQEFAQEEERAPDEQVSHAMYVMY